MIPEAKAPRRTWPLWLAGATLAACTGCCALTLAAQLVLPSASDLAPGFVVSACVVRGVTTSGIPRVTVLWMPPEGLKLVPPASRPRMACVYTPWLPSLRQSGGFVFPR